MMQITLSVSVKIKPQVPLLSISSKIKSHEHRISNIFAYYNKHRVSKQ